MSSASQSPAEIVTAINSHLESGGVVQVTTYLKSTVYTPEHSGWFAVDSSGCVSVRHGRKRACLSLKNGHMLVGIRFGRYVKSEAA